MENIIDDHITKYSESFYKPSLISRVKSTVIDSGVLLGLFFLFAFILNTLKIESGQIRGIALILIFLYEPVLVVLGGTFGQRLMGLEVVKASQFKGNGNSVKINFINSIIRYIAKVFLGWISLLTIHSSSYGQAIHDKLGNSLMTYK